MEKYDFKDFWKTITIEEVLHFVENWNYCLELNKFGVGNHAFVLEKKGK